MITWSWNDIDIKNKGKKDRGTKVTITAIQFKTLFLLALCIIKNMDFQNMKQVFSYLNTSTTWQSLQIRSFFDQFYKNRLKNDIDNCYWFISAANTPQNLPPLLGKIPICCIVFIIHVFYVTEETDLQKLLQASYIRHDVISAHYTSKVWCGRNNTLSKCHIKEDIEM